MNKVSIIPQDDAPVMAIPQVPAATSLLHVLGRAMSDPSIDVEKVERYAALYERAIAREDEIAFNQAMMQAQSEMRPIAAKANNPQTKSKYAKYEAVDAEARPIYTKHGFSLSFYTGEGAPEGSIRVQCKVSRGGHTERPYIDMPADGKGAKGGDVMTKTHATGAGVTYGRRYLLGMIFNLVIGGDDDGNAASRDTKLITQKQADDLNDLIEAKGANTVAFLKWVRNRYPTVEHLEDIPSDYFEACVNAVNNYQPKVK
jgi:hypothetical protein